MFLQKIRQRLVTLTSAIILLMPLAGGLVLSPAYADCTKPTTAKEQAECGIGLSGGDANGNNAENKVTGLAGDIVNIISLIVGIVAVIMVVIAGFKYVTSGGDSNRVSSAKNTLIYAIIGIAVVVLAQVIVHYVINTSADAVK